MTAILGKGRVHSEWSPAHSYLKEENNKISLIIEPFGQLDGKTVYNKSIDILIEKIDKLNEVL